MASDTWGWVYCLHDKINNICRIGKTKTSADNFGRIKSQTGYYPFPLEVIKFSFPNKNEAETHFHRTFKPKKVGGDWYSITPADFKREVQQYKFESDNTIKKAKAISKLTYVEPRHWYIIYGAREYKCEFITLYQIPVVLLRLKCRGKTVRIEIKQMFLYNLAKRGNEVICTALSSKGNKVVKIVFK